jgi:hypothetical protein
LGTLLVAAGLLLAAGKVQADQYRGNGNTDFDGAIGNGTLTLTLKAAVEVHPLGHGTV